ncbi:MAG: cytochrome c family protein [Euryarchaeota archaeon]|nr:cytochrome c family protein [Euryarchaeota archaeon]
MKVRLNKLFLATIIGFLLSITLVATTHEEAINALSEVTRQTEFGELKSNQFTSPETCGGCHTDIYAQWKGSMHSNSDQDQFYQKLFILASKETNGLTDTFCARCHTPVGLVSGEVPPVDGSKLSDIAKKGVQCDFCHTVSESKGIGNAPYVSSPGKVKRGPFKDAVSPFHETQFSVLHTKAEFCGMCHDVSHPVNKLPLESTYTEWKEGPYSKEGVQCQDCHMTPGVTKFQRNPGKAATMGPEREHIYTHYFVGGNTIYTESSKHRELAIQRLKAAAVLDISVPSTAAIGDMITVEITISNVGCGHKLPTGLTEAREMWLELTVKDAKGKEIFKSGELDADGNIDPNATIYHTVLADAQGKPTPKVWLAESVLFDKRIPPKGTAIEKYTFKLPTDIKGPITAEARLNYRTAPQYLIDSLFGKGAMKIPIVEMASKKSTINVPTKGICGPTTVLILTVIPLLLYEILRNSSRRKK